MKVHSWSIILLAIIVLLFLVVNHKEINYVPSNINGTKYLVRNTSNVEQASNMLAKIDINIRKLTSHLVKHIDNFKNNASYIRNLYSRTKKLVISEGSINSKYTSYTINKGEEIVFCLRSKDTGEFHDINLLMFVTIHELAHIACPEKDHTPLFEAIFIFLLNESIKIGIYQYQNYATNPVEYCGMKLNQTPI